MDFETIYRRYFRDVYLYIRSLTCDDALAEEIAQETFYKAFKGINRFDCSENIKAWLFTIARNTCFSFMKKRSVLHMAKYLNQLMIQYLLKRVSWTKRALWRFTVFFTK